MTTEQAPKIRIRQATPLDAVAVYKLLVDEELKTDSPVAFDPAARLVHIIDVIATGYVLVACNKSDRIVGTIGFRSGAPAYAKEPALVSDWLVLVPSIRNTPVGKKIAEVLLGKLTKFADLEGVIVRVFVPTDAKMIDQLKSAGFAPKLVQLVREPEMIDDATDEPTAGDSVEEQSGAEPSVGTAPPADPQ